MKNHKSISPIVAVALVSLASFSARADVASNLKVIRDAAKTGLWTISTSGKLGEVAIPSKTETVCVTKQEILENYKRAVWRDRGIEKEGCPTTLTTNTSIRGVATATCPPSQLVMGQKTIQVPQIKVSVEFEKVNSNQWTSTMDKAVTTMTYHGETTADCVKTR